MKMTDKSGRPRNLRFNWRNELSQFREEMALDSIQEFGDFEYDTDWSEDVLILFGEVIYEQPDRISWN